MTFDRSFRILVNPASGGGKAVTRAEPVAQALRKAGADVQVVVSIGVDHSREEVCVAAALGQTVVACGGDGMLSSVAGEVVTHGQTLGIIPGGRGNDFSRQLGIPDGDADAVANTLLTGKPTAVDVIRADDKIVLGSVYAGVDSLTSELVGRMQYLPSSVQYPYAAVRALLTCSPNHYRLELDGSSRELEAYSIVVANSGYYGKGMHVAPTANVDDGLLDVVVIPKASRLKLISLMPKIYPGTHVERDDVQTFRCRSVRIWAAEHVMAYGDGEPLMPLPLKADVAPGALTVLR